MLALDQLRTFAPQHASGSVRLITVASVSMSQLWLVRLSNDGYSHDRNPHQHYPQNRLDAEPRAFHVDIGDFVEFCLQRQGAADVHGRRLPLL
jgi:hypothetical protein